MDGALCYYKIDPKAKDRDAALKAEVEEAIIKFRQARGYNPTLLEIRADECPERLKFSIPHILKTKGLQPAHFMLYPSKVKRNPIIFMGVRSYQ